MRLVLFAAAALTASAGIALADQPVGEAAAKGGRQVFVCQPSSEANGSWVRECAAQSGASRLAAADRPAVTRRVFVCDRSAQTRRNWIREYGEMTFVTADELTRAEAANEGWTVPRCMTGAEARRFAKDRPETATAARAIDLADGQ